MSSRQGLKGKPLELPRQPADFSQSVILTMRMPQVGQTVIIGKYPQTVLLVIMGGAHNLGHCRQFSLEGMMVADGAAETRDYGSSMIHHDTANARQMMGILFDTRTVAPGTGPAVWQRCGI